MKQQGNGFGILNFIQEYFFEKELIEMKQKYQKRRPLSKTEVYEYKIAGKQQCYKILNFLYDEETEIFRLDRKYQKFLDIFN